MCYSVHFKFLLGSKSQSNIPSIPQRSLEVIGFNQDEIFSIFTILAVVLKLGNLMFIPTTNIDGSEGCEISNEYGTDG